MRRPHYEWVIEILDTPALVFFVICFVVIIACCTVLGMWFVDWIKEQCSREE